LSRLGLSLPAHAYPPSRRRLRELDRYLEAHEPTAFWGVELDIPTVPFHGRRPDFCYYSTADVSRVDLRTNRVLGVPTLVVEVLSEEDEERDTITKRKEYADAGIEHYWILDPQRRTALTLALRGDECVEVGTFSGQKVLTSALLPGLEIPLSRLFR
jgi:Uma2 family endonuclease